MYQRRLKYYNSFCYQQRRWEQKPAKVDHRCRSLAEVRRETEPAFDSNVLSDRWKIPQKFDLPIPAPHAAETCAKAFRAVCLCCWRSAERRALPEGTGLGRHSLCIHSASCRCPDVWWGFSATGTPLCSRFLSACDSTKTNSAQFNIISDTALRSLGGRDWYQMLWYGFLKDRLR